MTTKCTDCDNVVFKDGYCKKCFDEIVDYDSKLFFDNVASFMEKEDISMDVLKTSLITLLARICRSQGLDKSYVLTMSNDIIEYEFNDDTKPTLTLVKKTE